MASHLADNLSSIAPTWSGHELWTLQLSPLYRPEDGIEKSCRKVGILKMGPGRLNPNLEIDCGRHNPNLEIDCVRLNVKLELYTVAVLTSSQIWK
jgi:hypothetical protein